MDSNAERDKLVRQLVKEAEGANLPRPVTVKAATADHKAAPAEAATTSEERLADMVFLAQKKYTEGFVEHKMRPFTDGLAAVRAELDQLRTETRTEITTLRRSNAQLTTKVTVLTAKLRGQRGG